MIFSKEIPKTVMDNLKSGYTIDFHLPKAPAIDAIDRTFQEIKNLNSDYITDISILTFADVIRYCQTKTPKIMGIKKAGIYRDIHPQGHLIVLFFVDNKDEIATDKDGEMYGRIILAKELDEELKKILSKDNVVILR